MSGLPGATGILTAAEALDLVRGEFGLRSAEPAPSRSLLAVEVSSPSRAVEELAHLSVTLPCVFVGVDTTGAEAPEGFDLLLSTQATGRPWVQTDDPAAALEDLRSGVERAPLAAVALAQLLRFGPELSLPDAVIAESFVYSMLQSGPEFKAWLRSRRTPSGRRDPEAEPVVITRDGAHLEIELNRPAVRNALNAAMREGLMTALQIVLVDPSIESARLSGRGPGFCSGGDLSEFGSFTDPATAHAVRVGRSVGLTLSRCADRVAVQVHGPCIGAGIEIPAFSRRVVARGDATFSLPEVGFGLIPGAGGTASLPRRIGRHRTAYLALTGTSLDAASALEWGLVDELSD